ncbi:MAG: response regulator [Bacteroidota bacterium]
MAVPREFHHIRERFKAEVDQHLNNATGDIQNLNPLDKAVLDRIARHLHAIKGSAPIVGAKPISEVARAAEESILLINERPSLWSKDRAAILLESFEFMKRQVREFVEGEPIDDGSGMIARMESEFPGAREAAKKGNTGGGVSTLRAAASAVADSQKLKQKVLFVDDSLIARELYKVLLVNRGFDVETAGDGNEALEHLRRTKFDIVITDDQMPEMDGTELLRLSRSDAALQSIPFVVISGKANDEARAKALEWGAAAYLIKGDFEKEHLLEVVAQVLSKGGKR